MQQSHVVVMAERGTQLEQARALADSLQLQLVLDSIAPADASFALTYGEGGLGLRLLAGQAPGTVRVDFSSASLSWRAGDAVGKQAIARAAGVKAGVTPSVIDATAGFGRDAYLLASLGCEVTLIEKSPLVYALLKDGLERGLAADPGTARIVARMHLRQGKFQEICAGSQADVVYLDPMFPPRSKSARVKKELFVLQQLLGHEAVPPDLLQTALQVATLRVVVKRPRLAAALEPPSPSHSYTGKTSRYDIYPIPRK